MQSPESGYQWIERRGGYLTELIKANSSVVEGGEVCDDREEVEMKGDEVEVEGC